MAKSMRPEVKNVPLVILDVIDFSQAIEGMIDSACAQRLPLQETSPVSFFVFRGWKEPAVRIFFRSVLLHDQCELSQDDGSDFLRDGNSVVEHARFLNIPNEPELAFLVLETEFLFQREDI